MDEQSMLNRIHTLKTIKQLKASQHLDFLKNCPDEYIHAVCEACYNILNQSLKLSKDQKHRLKKKLKPIRNDVRKLSNPKLSVKTKREMLITQFFQCPLCLLLFRPKEQQKSFKKRK